jgi:hypothetical protein
MTCLSSFVDTRSERCYDCSLVLSDFAYALGAHHEMAGRHRQWQADGLWRPDRHYPADIAVLCVGLCLFGDCAWRAAASCFACHYPHAVGDDGATCLSVAGGHAAVNSHDLVPAHFHFNACAQDADSYRHSTANPYRLGYFGSANADAHTHCDSLGYTLAIAYSYHADADTYGYASGRDGYASGRDGYTYRHAGTYGYGHAGPADAH